METTMKGLGCALLAATMLDDFAELLLLCKKSSA
jgi:hypothetical protein